MKKAFLLILLLALPGTASAENAATYRERGDTLRADGRFEEAVAEYKRALAENHLLPADSGAVSLRDKRPLCGAISRRRTEIGLHLSSSEGH